MQTIFFLLLISFFFVGINSSYAQEPQLATFQETAQILFDKQISKNVTASVTLQSTSNQEMNVPSELERRILDNPHINSIVLTNEEQCVLGVVKESCIMINVNRDEAWKGIFAIQDESKKIGDSFIEDVNNVFDTDAKFHSVFVHFQDEMNVALETSGVISGKGTVSVVYTMPLEETSSMYEKISGILLPKIIRDAGGFYELAKKLSSEPNAKMSFSIIPQESNSIFQLKLSVDYPGQADVSKIEPLKFLKTEELTRSDYFSSGFYPLNSLIQVAIVSSQPDKVQETISEILPTQVVLGDKVPTQLTKHGWIFDPESGQRIEGKYLFGEKTTVTENELIFALASYEGELVDKETSQEDESFLVAIIISIVAGGAVAFYLKGYKKSP